MTNKTRYFFIAAGLVLLVGVGVGLVAYYNTARVALIPRGLPDELRYVPQTAELVAYADIQGVMNSELRRELERASGGGERRGRRDFNDFAGIDFEKQVHHVVGYLEPASASAADAATADKPAVPNAPVAPNAPPAPAPGAPPAPVAPSAPVEPGAGAVDGRAGLRGVVMAQGSFDQTKVEQFIVEHGGAIEDYRGKHISVHRDDAQDAVPDDQRGRGRGRRSGNMAVGFLQPDLIVLGDVDLVRRAIDQSAGSSSSNVTNNEDVMRMVRDASGETAWVVGHFDAVSRRIGIPGSMRSQVPPLRMVAAKAHVNGGVRATIKAETADQAAADQMRDLIRGFVALMRMQANNKPELQNTLKTLELGGTGSTVQLSFALTPETFRAVMPQRRDRVSP